MRKSPQHKLSKSAIKAWRVSTSLVMLLLIAIPIFLWGYYFLDSQYGFLSQWMLFAVSVILFVAASLCILFIPEIRWRRWYYQIDEHEIDLQSGIVIITRTLIPIKRVQHVNSRQGPILRSFGLADVTISTAATTHRIPALSEEVADQVRNEISKFAQLAEEDV